MVKGGYQIVDMKNKAIVTGAVSNHPTIAGAFDALENPYRKMTVISRLTLDTVEYPDFPAVFVKSGDNMVGTLSPLTAFVDATTATAYIMTVTPADVVTVASAAVTSAT